MWLLTTTSDEYVACFGFTETKVFAAADEFGMVNKDGDKRHR